jgi:hypothetical protein
VINTFFIVSIVLYQIGKVFALMSRANTLKINLIAVIMLPNRTMNKYTILLSATLVLIITAFIWQSSDIEAENRKIFGAEVQGYKLRLGDEKGAVETFWNEYAKEYGKPEKGKEYWVYETNPWKEEGISYAIYVQISQRPGHSSLWMGLDPEKIKKDEYAKKSERVFGVVDEFRKYVILQKIQKQIEEAEQATAFLSKQFDQLKKTERSTAKNQELNLERLEKYKRDVLTLQADSAKYVKKMTELNASIDSVYKEMESLKKILEMQRERIKKIE